MNALLAEPGATQSSVAARLGISQSRVSQLLSGKSGHESRAANSQAHNSQPVVQPPVAVSSQPGPAHACVPSEAVMSQLRAEIKAGLTAAIRAKYAARIAERDEARLELAAALARIAELEASPPAPALPGAPRGSCPRHGALVLVCPACEGLSDD